MGKGERTRQAVIARALAIASRRGLEGITIGGLAREVGLSKSGLFAHFESKEDLQLRVLEEAVDRFVRRVVRPAFGQPPGEPRIRALFDRWLDWETDSSLPGGCPFVALASELDDRPGTLREFLAAAQAEWLATLATAARLAIDRGDFRRDIDSGQFAQDFYGIALAYHHAHRLLEDGGAESRARAAFERLLMTCRTS